MSSELEARHGSLVIRVAQLEASVRERRQAQAAAREKEQQLALKLEVARHALAAEQARQRDCRQRYVQAERFAYEHVKKGVDIGSPGSAADATVKLEAKAGEFLPLLIACLAVSR